MKRHPLEICAAVLCTITLASPLPVSAQEAPPAAESGEVSEPASEAPAPSVEPAQCVPACRTGYICHEGECISACNPPCAEGQSCTAEGECVAPQEGPSTGSSGGEEGVVVALSGCVSDHQCAHPRRCVEGSCELPAGYVDALESEARSRTIAGAVVMGIGGLLMVASAIPFGLGSAAKNSGESDDSQYIAGYSMLGLGLAVTISGSIPLGIGRDKARRAKALRARQRAAE